MSVLPDWQTQVSPIHLALPLQSKKATHPPPMSSSTTEFMKNSAKSDSVLCKMHLNINVFLTERKFLIIVATVYLFCRMSMHLNCA